MNGVKTTLGELCENEGKSLLQAVSLTTQARGGVRRARAGPERHRRAKILQVGQFNINFSDDDRERLVAANAEIAKAQREVRVKQIGVAGAAADAQAAQFELDQKFGQDARYVKELAGSYQGYAAGQAMIGAGQGMAEHGVGGGIAGLGAQMAVGMGVGNAMAGRASAPQPHAGADVLARRHAGDLRQVRREAAGREVLRRVRRPLARAEEVLQRLRRRADARREVLRELRNAAAGGGSG